MDLIDVAIKILDEGPICDSCLGRQFGKLSTGLTNKERGWAIKTVLSMMEIETLKIENLKIKEGEKCWICNGLFDELKDWSNMAIEKLKDYDFDTFLVGTKVTGLISENEEIIWAESQTTWAEPAKSEINREVGKLISQKTQKEVDFLRPDVVLLLDLDEEEVKVQPNSLFIYGRYRKLIRGIPQTRWICRECGGSGCDLCEGTGKRYKESIEELLTWIVLDEFSGSDCLLHGAGREDIDALMLGEGRPFVLEIKEPIFRKVDLTRLQKKINEENSGKIEVFGLIYAEKSMVETVKNTKSDKVYRIKILLDDKVDIEKLKEALDNLKGIINQKTPKRVIHRRADMIRIRKVHVAKLISLEEKEAVIEIDCEGGLYIKELMTGDEKRTNPNLSELLGTNLKVNELDVINVKLEEELIKKHWRI